jgi:TRAP-type mannitol/chloroaromatic compound transport system permease small subunit
MGNQTPFWILPIGILMIVIGCYMLPKQWKEWGMEKREDYDKIYYMAKIFRSWGLVLLCGIAFVLRYIFSL